MTEDPRREKEQGIVAEGMRREKRYVKHKQKSSNDSIESLALSSALNNSGEANNSAGTSSLGAVKNTDDTSVLPVGSESSSSPEAPLTYSPPLRTYSPSGYHGKRTPASANPLALGRDKLLEDELKEESELDQDSSLQQDSSEAPPPPSTQPTPRPPPKRYPNLNPPLGSTKPRPPALKKPRKPKKRDRFVPAPVLHFFRRYLVSPVRTAVRSKSKVQFTGLNPYNKYDPTQSIVPQDDEPADRVFDAAAPIRRPGSTTSTTKAVDKASLEAFKKAPLQKYTSLFADFEEEAKKYAAGESSGKSENVKPAQTAASGPRGISIPGVQNRTLSEKEVQQPEASGQSSSSKSKSEDKSRFSHNRGPLKGDKDVRYPFYFTR
ncbi:hypothetical protein ABW19_dt0208507 [Dactylella cylindrospora]|nr:hypothetical protein ABW19_dt0208507 [Dactylella cylindrospora]